MSGPSSLNVSVNSYANFSCTVSNAITILWKINNDSIKIFNLPEFNDGAENITFYVGENLDFNVINESNITCLAVGSINDGIVLTNTSSPALLLIQGKNSMYLRLSKQQITAYSLTKGVTTFPTDQYFKASNRNGKERIIYHGCIFFVSYIYLRQVYA